jgi:hypothetical protein
VEEGAKQVSLELQPITLKKANAFIRAHHRHHPHARGCHFCIAATEQGQLHAVAVIGRPNARHLQDGTTCELTRLCTDGTPNAASFLLGAARRAAQTLGFKKLITYTLQQEPGTSLIAAGWTLTAQTPGGTWHRTNRPRQQSSPNEPKKRWEA